MRELSVGLAKRVFLILATFSLSLILYMFYDLGITRRNQASNWEKINSFKREIITCLERGKSHQCQPEYLSVRINAA